MGRVKVMANFTFMQDPTEKPHFDLKAPLMPPTIINDHQRDLQLAMKEGENFKRSGVCKQYIV